MSNPPREFTLDEYRRQTAWSDRLRREGPFLDALLSHAPSGGSIVDLGCGSGEHARYLAGQGHRVIGMDRSRDALRSAVLTSVETPRGSSIEGRIHWVRSDLRSIPLVTHAARVVLCLGNTLVLLEEDEAILRSLREIHRVLLPGGCCLLQILNYHRLRRKGIRNLPLNFRPDTADLAGATELLYLRLMDFDEPDHASFHVVTLERRSRSNAVRVRDSVRRRLRTLCAVDLASMLRAAGFVDVVLHGDYEGRPLDPEESTDVIAVCHRSPLVAPH